jgi:poly(hydroxyalkanoate) granule-associated protein
MSKPKFKSKPASASASAKSGALVETAQQVWLAGIDALTRAQSQGGKLFETLVKEGVSLEQKTRKFATGKVGEVRDVVENKVEQVKERAADTWDKLETVFEARVSKALSKLGVPGREEMEALIDRVEELNRAVRKLNAKSEPSLKNTVSKAARDSINAVVGTMTGAGKNSSKAGKRAARPAARKAKATPRKTKAAASA